MQVGAQVHHAFCGLRPGKLCHQVCNAPVGIAVQAVFEFGLSPGADRLQQRPGRPPQALVKCFHITRVNRLQALRKNPVGGLHVLKCFANTAGVYKGRGSRAIVV